MKALAVIALAAVCVLSGCSRTTDGVVAQTTEPVSAAGMTCADFSILGDRDQLAVVEEILPDANAGRRALAGGLADVLCRAAPEAEVAKLLEGLASR